jgi:hypothetical protein
MSLVSRISALSTSIQSELNSRKCLVAIYQEQQTSGTNGGTFTSGAWRTRLLNTEVSDPGEIGTLSSNRVTLVPGRYLIEGIGTATGTNGHQLRLWNSTSSTVLSLGVNFWTNTISNALVSWTGTLSSGQALELQHRCSVTRASDGYGQALSWGTEVYSQLRIVKIG